MQGGEPFKSEDSRVHAYSCQAITTKVTPFKVLEAEEQISFQACYIAKSYEKGKTELRDRLRDDKRRWALQLFRNTIVVVSQ